MRWAERGWFKGARVGGWRIWIRDGWVISSVWVGNGCSFRPPRVARLVVECRLLLLMRVRKWKRASSFDSPENSLCRCYHWLHLLVPLLCNMLLGSLQCNLRVMRSTLPLDGGFRARNVAVLGRDRFLHGQCRAVLLEVSGVGGWGAVGF